MVVMLKMKIPFYEAGRISEIQEENKFYMVSRYEVDGKHCKTFKVHKKSKNLDELLENYYDDLEGYLKFYRSKYEEYKNNNFKKIEYMKNFKKLKFLIFTLTLLPLAGYLIEIDFLFQLGIALDFIFVPTFLALDSGSRKYEKEREKEYFVRCYTNYSKELDAHNKNNKKKTVYPTKYTSVDLSRRNEENLVINKIKEKKAA